MEAQEAELTKLDGSVDEVAKVEALDVEESRNLGSQAARKMESWES